MVFTRYSFHHFLDPKAVLAEMVRVCEPGGKVAVVDVFTTTPEQAAAYDQVEKLRDPSHTRALLLDELTGLFRDAGLSDIKTEFYKLEVELEKILASSFPNPGDADKIRQIFSEDLGVNRLGVGAHRKDGGHLVRLSNRYPCRHEVATFVPAGPICKSSLRRAGHFGRMPKTAFGKPFV